MSYKSNDDFEKSFRTLTDSLLLDLEHLHRHTRLVVRANEWDKGRSDSLLLRGDDLASAELWLGESEGKDPQPTELQETYIKKSRDVEAASDRAAAILREAVEKAAKKKPAAKKHESVGQPKKEKHSRRRELFNKWRAAAGRQRRTQEARKRRRRAPK